MKKFLIFHFTIQLIVSLFLIWAGMFIWNGNYKVFLEIFNPILWFNCFFIVIPYTGGAALLYKWVTSNWSIQRKNK